MKRKTSIRIVLFFFVILILTCKTHAEVPYRSPLNTQSKQTGVTPISPVQKASDISLERVYLKDCRIHVLIRNIGSGAVSNEDYQNGELLVLIGKFDGTFEKKSFKFKDVDPQYILRTPAQQIEFDTKISLQESQSVKVQLERFKNDGKTGKKYLVTKLVISSVCKDLVTPKHETKTAPPSLKPKEEAHPTIKERFSRTTPPLKETPKEISKIQETFSEKPLKTKEKTLFISRELETLEGTITPASSSPRRIGGPPPQPQPNEIPALMLDGTKSDEVTTDITVDGLDRFVIRWDIEQFRMRETRVRDFPIKTLDKVNLRVVYLGEQNNVIFEKSWTGYPEDFIFLERDIINWLRSKNLFRWDKLTYKLRLEGEAIYKINPPRGGNIPELQTPELQTQDSGNRYPLNSIILTCNVRVDPEIPCSYPGVRLTPSITVESSRILREVTPTGVSLPSQREVVLKVKVKNEGTKSTSDAITHIGNEAYSQSTHLTKGSFWVTVYRCYAGSVGCKESIATFLVDPLAPGQEWTSSAITDTTSAEEIIQYRVFADTLNFICEEFDGRYHVFTDYFERYWDTRTDINIRISRITVEPDTIPANGNATVYVEVLNQSQENVPVIFRLVQPSPIEVVCETKGYAPSMLPISLQPGINRIQLSISNFNPPSANQVALGVAIYKAYASKVYNEYVGYGIWDKEIMNVTQTSSGQYTFTQVPTTFRITHPEGGKHYKSKYPPFSIYWDAYDPNDQVSGDVELYYRIKQNNQWTNWQFITSVPVESRYYTWEPNFTSSGEVETQIRAVWKKPQQNLPAESGVFYMEFQSNYSAYGIEITNPASNTIWESGRSYTVSWRVDPQRYTRIPLINLYRVDASGRTTEQGWRLAENISIRNNEGSVSITVPNVSTSQGDFLVRIKLYLEWDYEQSARSGQFIPRLPEIWSDIFRVRQN